MTNADTEASQIPLCPMPVRAVLFDLGNTLVSYYAADQFPMILRRCLASCVAELGLKDAGEPGEELFNRAIALNQEAPGHGVRPLAERLAIIFPQSRSDQGLLGRLGRSFLEPIFATARCDPDALEVLGTLRSRGLRTGIVSNTPWGSPGDAWRGELSRHGLLDAVDTAVFCVDVGYRKPHPAPIRRALETLNVDPHDALFVGDDPRWDLAGAQAAGVRAVLLACPAGTAPSGEFRIISQLKEVLHCIQTGSD